MARQGSPLTVRLVPGLLAAVDAAVEHANEVRPDGAPKVTRNGWINQAVEAHLPEVREVAGIRPPNPTAHPLYVVECHRVKSSGTWRWEVPGGFPGGRLRGRCPSKTQVVDAAWEALAAELGHDRFELKAEWP